MTAAALLYGSIEPYTVLLRSNHEEGKAPRTEERRMPRQVDHDLRRRQIAEAVWRLAARGGLENVTLRQVAAEAICTPTPNSGPARA
jgi:hypothetical protein